ncbi:MAG: putative Ig domain-containing protein [Gammaproteobacteria bacterium]|nr:putative Ig domain-containing protein [Gammaproteobacteria bacterium]
MAAAGMGGTAQAEADRLYALRTRDGTAVWGGYGGSGVDFFDTALGLSALRSGDPAYASKAAATPSNNGLLSAFCGLATGRISEGAGKQAWPATEAVTGQSAGQGQPSVVITALLLNELHSMQVAVSSSFSVATCGSSTYAFAALTSEAQAWLPDQQNADGGFGERRSDGSSGASSVVVTALVYQALNKQSTPSQPQTSDAQTWLLGAQDPVTGSWQHDALVTAQAIVALPVAAGGQLTDSSGDGITDVVALQLGIDPGLANARQYIGNPSLATPGETYSAFVVEAIKGVSFSLALDGSGPFGLRSGSLPPGLMINASTGQISGTPIQPGSYSFDYLSGDGHVIGRIDVVEPVVVAGDDEVVSLPSWSLTVLGVVLIGVFMRRRRATATPT